MHLSKSSTPMTSPLSYNSAKLSHRGQPPLEWTNPQHQAPTCAPTPPWIPSPPLPHMVSPIFAGEPPSSHAGGIYQPAGRAGYYQPAQLYAPYLSSIPLPHHNPNSPSSRQSSHSSRSYHNIYLNELLAPHKIEFLISSFPSTTDIVCVPQDLKKPNYLLQAENIDAFAPQQNSIVLQFTPNNDLTLDLRTSGSLTVAFILRNLHAYLHSCISRNQFAALSPERQRAAKESRTRRCAQGRVVPSQGFVILEALGLDNMAFIGLRRGEEAHVWIPLFQGARRA
ncbi:hypothetical protein B0H16DRAFT_1682857 [Mycena metata]|uniref:DUF6699 domain-containing protein n=1 Tax=Mycena metata TaxID=1033252 RepID=A0AAD7KEH3_9AGAR|nr:hypothetical protein B0H16DRAFT_1682857 [Mycena metata]